ncbi:hypothetical protein [Acidaminococcus intestini]|uniref:hypothetical protein n=1 Tax=Acidaminococcus intestini TaxID=187327 RepID=UPI003AEF4C6E
METFSYISELNAFDAWLTYHELPPSSIVLWFALMRISNSLGRKTVFNASLSLLSTKCGQMDDRTIRNARKRLEEEGLISFQSRKGLRSAVYTLHLLSVEKKEKNVSSDFRSFYENGEKKEKNVPSDFHIHKSKSKDYKSKSIYIGGQTKEVIHEFESKIHPIANLTERENLLDLIETYGTMDVMEAIQKASGYRGTSIQYVASILANKKRGVRNGNQQGNSGLPQSPLPGGYDEAAERKRQRVLKELGIIKDD